MTRIGVGRRDRQKRHRFYRVHQMHVTHMIHAVRIVKAGESFQGHRRRGNGIEIGIDGNYITFFRPSPLKYTRVHCPENTDSVKTNVLTPTGYQKKKKIRNPHMYQEYLRKGSNQYFKNSV